MLDEARGPWVTASVRFREGQSWLVRAKARPRPSGGVALWPLARKTEFHAGKDLGVLRALSPWGTGQSCVSRPLWPSRQTDRVGVGTCLDRGAHRTG